MTPPIAVFVNDRRVAVAAGVPAAAAVAAADPALGAVLGAGRAHLTDGRGIRLDPGEPLTAGAIIRVVLSARRLPDTGPSERDDAGHP